jgi:hypothetical protein
VQTIKLSDEIIVRMRHAGDLARKAEDLDFAKLLFVIGEFEVLLEVLGISSEPDDD